MFKTADMLKIFAKYRGDSIVVSGRGGKHWINISDTPLDVPLGDPAMGGHAAFAFGLAMALPQKKIVLFDSEGDLQMSLGVLITIAEQKPANFYHFMLDNECYATTGGQPVPNAKNVKYDEMARGAGLSARFCVRRARRVLESAARHPREKRTRFRRDESRAGDRERSDRQPQEMADAHAAAGGRRSQERAADRLGE